MTTAVPPPMPPSKSNATDIGVLKAILISSAIIALISFLILKFIHDRAKAEAISQETKERVQESQELIRKSEETRRQIKEKYGIQ
jgi:uncharacterized membrane protein (DUF106 family)